MSSQKLRKPEGTQLFLILITFNEWWHRARDQPIFKTNFMISSDNLLISKSKNQQNKLVKDLVIQLNFQCKVLKNILPLVVKAIYVLLLVAIYSLKSLLRSIATKVKMKIHRNKHGNHRKVSHLSILTQAFKILKRESSRKLIHIQVNYTKSKLPRKHLTKSQHFRGKLQLLKTSLDSLNSKHKPTLMTSISNCNKKK